MNKIQQAYCKLLKAYGKQGWWPIVNDKTLLCEYGTGAPRNEAEMAEMCIGAILTQNTAWKNVEKAIANLKRNSLIDFSKIAAMDAEKLAQLIKSSGYYNQKTRKLKLFAEHVVGNYGGSLERMLGKSVGELREELLSLHGIGPETADSIMLYAAGKTVFVIDAYTKRVFARIGISREGSSYDELQRMFMESLPSDSSLFNEYHALIVELGKGVCRKKPLCSNCPLKGLCKHLNRLSV